FEVKIFDLKSQLRNTGDVPSAEPHGGLAGPAGVPDIDVPPAGAACAPVGPVGDPDTWDWPRDAVSFPDDAPLQALMLSATKLMGAYGQDSVRAAGLKLSLAGLGVLRILMSEDGLKASEVADRAWSSPGTLTSVVNTLVRDGFVERRPDETDRRVVRLCITDQGRAVITYYVSRAAAWWRKAFDFVDSDDEAVVRRFFTQMINHLSQLIDEERGA
ncbi:MAG: regulatory protein MarR, partial [Actinomycetia bacterium]|nr:regulatory protein MarR [Actinomycetes bacterium]